MGKALVLEPETVCAMSPHSLLPVSHHRVGILLVVLRLLKIMLVPEKIRGKSTLTTDVEPPSTKTGPLFLLTLF